MGFVWTIFYNFADMNRASILRVKETESTNRDLEKWIRGNVLDNNELPEFYMLMADYQTAGRGQGTNRWHSAPQLNLLASIYFRPPLPASRQFVFNEYFALAVKECLSCYVKEVMVKWPNDIYVGNKKIAGILIEHSVFGDTLFSTIAGIGLNVNEKEFPDWIPNPTSLALLTGSEFSVEEVAARLHAQLQNTYSRLQPDGWEALNADYLGSLCRMNEWSRYEIGGREVEARIVGVDEYGRLLLEGRGGERWCCGMKEVRYLW